MKLGISAPRHEHRCGLIQHVAVYMFRFFQLLIYVEALDAKPGVSTTTTMDKHRFGLIEHMSVAVFAQTCIALCDMLKQLFASEVQVSFTVRGCSNRPPDTLPKDSVAQVLKQTGLRTGISAAVVERDLKHARMISCNGDLINVASDTTTGSKDPPQKKTKVNHREPEYYAFADVVAMLLLRVVRVLDDAIHDTTLRMASNDITSMFSLVGQAYGGITGEPWLLGEIPVNDVVQHLTGECAAIANIDLSSCGLGEHVSKASRSIFPRCVFVGEDALASKMY